MFTNFITPAERTRFYHYARTRQKPHPCPVAADSTRYFTSRIIGGTESSVRKHEAFSDSAIIAIADFAASSLVPGTRIERILLEHE